MRRILTAAAVGLVAVGTSLAVAGPAAAYSDGSPCSIAVSTLGQPAVTVPGTVKIMGDFHGCVPSTPIADLNNFNTFGTPCNEDYWTIIISLHTTC